MRRRILRRFVLREEGGWCCGFLQGQQRVAEALVHSGLEMLSMMREFSESMICGLW